MKFLFVTSIIFLSCQSSTKENIDLKDDTLKVSNSFSDTILQNKILDTLSKLSFIKKSNDYIDSVTKQKKSIAFLMDTLSKGDTDIFVRAGYNGEYRFQTYYQIYVNPITMEIKIYDPVNDRKLSIREYEKINK